MILSAYACLLIGGAVFLRNAAVDVSGRSAMPVRILAILGGLGFAALGAGLLDQGDRTGPGRALATMLIVGGITYDWGVVRWQARGGLAVRRAGWLLVVAVLAVPTTLTLLLPIACLLLPTLHEPVATRRAPRAPGSRPGPQSSRGS